MKKNLELKVNNNNCEHCGRTFIRDSTLLKHLCEQKRRWMDADRPSSRIGYSAWSEFYSICQPSKKKKDYAAFIQSPYYSSFVKFGNYCVDIKAVGVPSYINYLIRANVPIDDWTRDSVYSIFLTDYLRSENSLDAITRSIKNIALECDSENIDLRDFFRYASQNKICQMIITGKISPWMIYHSKAGLEFLENINESHRSVIFNYIDPEKWMIKFKRNAQETKQASELLMQTKL